MMATGEEGGVRACQWHVTCYVVHETPVSFLVLLTL